MTAFMYNTVFYILFFRLKGTCQLWILQLKLRTAHATPLRRPPSLLASAAAIALVYSRHIITIWLAPIASN